MGTLSLLLLLLLPGPVRNGPHRTGPVPEASATPQEAAVGTWTGTLVVPGAELPILFHIQAGEGGGFTATMDSPAQGATGIPVSEVTITGGHVRLVSAAVGGEFEGDLSPEGAELVGTWRQGGGEFDLTLVREGSQPVVEPTEAQRPLVGSWLGTLEVPGGGQLRMVFHIKPKADGGFTATMDSPDQGATGIPVSEVSFSAGHVRLFLAVAAGTFEGDLAPEGGRLEGTWTQGGMELPLTMERTEGGVEPPSRPQEPEPPFPYSEEEVRIVNPDGGHALAGTLTVPEGNGPFPAVVLVSGSGPQDRDETVFGHRPFLVLADHLSRRGIAVLRYDDRGVGGSEGDFGSATSDDFVSDALAGVSFLKTRSHVAAGAVGIIGHSEGGLVAPLAAVRSPDVSFIVMMAGPGVTGEEILLEQGALIARASGASEGAIQRNRSLQERLFSIVKNESDPDAARPLLESAMRSSLGEMTEEERAAAGLTGDTEAQVVANQVRSVNSAWFRFFLTHDPAPVLREVSVPVLALIGELDLQVPPGQNLPVIRAALEEAGTLDATVLELPRLNHLFQTAATGSPLEYARIEETLAPQALQTISDWILKRTAGTG